MKILIVEDNDILRKNIKKYLELQKYEVDDHATYDGAVSKILSGGYQAVILDLGLGSDAGDGIDICKKVREAGSAVGILMLTARTLTEQKVHGLDIGADDYMVKPFDYTELLARVRAVVRRDNTQKGKIIHLQNLEISEEDMTVKLDGTPVELSRLEFKLLLYLAHNHGRILSKEDIQERVWGEIDLFTESRNVDIYIGYLRKKLGKDLIETVRGVGYRIS